MSELKDLMAETGRLLLYWGFLEQQVEETIAARGLVVSNGPLADKVRSLSLSADLLEESRTLSNVRNLVAHGLAGARAVPDSEEASVTCRGRDGSRTRITISGLASATERLDRLRHQIRRLAWKV